MVVLFGAWSFVQTGSMEIAGIVLIVLALGITFSVLKNVVTWQKSIPEHEPILSAVILLFTVILNIMIVVISPVNDLWYYLGDAVCIVGLVISAICMLRVYNVGTTRPLPKLFDRNEVD